MNVGLAGLLSFAISKLTPATNDHGRLYGFISNNFDLSIARHDLADPRQLQGKLIIKAIPDADDARNAVRLGADGIVVSNHGGRQLDGAIPTPGRYQGGDAVGDDLDSACRFRVRSGVTSFACWPRREAACCFGRALYLCPRRGGRSGRGASAALICRGYEG